MYLILTCIKAVPPPPLQSSDPRDAPAKARSECEDIVGGVMAIDPNCCDDQGDCIAECSTGAIETWIAVDDASGGRWSVEEQFTWERLPGPALV